MSNIPDDIFTPETQNKKASQAVLIVTDDKTEDLEFFYPYYRFIEEGFRVDVVTPEGGTFKGKNGYKFPDTKKIKDVDPSQYALLYIPGGKAPAKLKKDENAVNLVRRFVQSGKLIAAICHGPQLLAEANVINGRKISAWPDVEGEVCDAGAEYVSEEAIHDGLFITSRWPADLPAFVKKTMQVLEYTSQSTQSTSRSAA